MVVTTARTVRYHDDAAKLFAHLGGLHTSDAVLLEGADIASKKKTVCFAVLAAALRITCMGQQVRVDTLTRIGEDLLAQLCMLTEQPPVTRGENFAIWEYTPATDVDEHQRLLRTNNTEILSLLQHHAPYRSEYLPFVAGGFAFDYVATFEQLPAVTMAENTYPDYQFVVAEQLLRIDHRTQEATLEVLGQNAEDAARTADQVAAAIAVADLSGDAAATAIAASGSATAATGAAGAADPAADPTAHVVTADAAATANLATPTPRIAATTPTSDAEFRAHVTAVQHAIDIGDAYQVVPSRMFRMPCPDAFAAYTQLRAENPSPYMFYVRGVSGGQSYELFGASPESNLTFAADTREVQLYPIAGTRKRGLHPDGSIHHELDIRAELEMRTDAKELAEHTMLVDLARNDLARVAVPATRQVRDLLHVDRYSRVMHLVSRVTATLAPEFQALDAYRACMNMGTLTGAPKLRAMEIIRELEHHRRGSYGGALGYFTGDGSMDTCIMIRCAFVQHGQAIVQAGAGVVRDSQPQAEADETVQKAYAVLAAIAHAQHAEVEVHHQ
ncbi:anthranilate synthase component 1 [Corynebacterium sp. HS2168-gen11]|uniref:anthranilate synthase component 1 n=1 Tax=Corynebacterium sp. HS2168-gen11 TaxID=2974027 RepID=UPI00216AFC7C|nr:anthranilate synthase component 1 [Corynebacterium sp. HS2168-gen11]MCS4535464.1 anthranilate synthase component 1 [Corynebacterium sp. HS2168-gen11]